MNISQWEKLIKKILNLSNDVRFDELRKIIESYGYVMTSPRGGSSHYIFRKAGHNPITIPKHDPIKLVYVKLVKNMLEEENNEKD